MDAPFPPRVARGVQGQGRGEKLMGSIMGAAALVNRLWHFYAGEKIKNSGRTILDHLWHARS